MDVCAVQCPNQRRNIGTVYRERHRVYQNMARHPSNAARGGHCTSQYDVLAADPDRSPVPLLTVGPDRARVLRSRPEKGYFAPVGLLTCFERSLVGRRSRSILEGHGKLTPGNIRQDYPVDCAHVDARSRHFP